jgi:hypothetical protein
MCETPECITEYVTKRHTWLRQQYLYASRELNDIAEGV